MLFATRRGLRPSRDEPFARPTVKQSKVEQLNRGESYLKHIPSESIAEIRRLGTFEATRDYDRLPECDAILICVPTPLNRTQEPDLSYVESSCRAIADRLRTGQLVVLESTTYPGTTDEVMKPILEASGLKCAPGFAEDATSQGV